MTKDELRLQRAIDKGWAKLEKDFQANLLLHVAQQKQFEFYCEQNNLIYSPF